MARLTDATDAGWTTELTSTADTPATQAHRDTRNNMISRLRQTACTSRTSVEPKGRIEKVAGRLFEGEEAVLHVTG
jgi:hypothetical protein